MSNYKTFDEMFNDDKIVSPEEREQINFQVSLIGKMIEAREKKGLSQRDLAELSGVKQPAIARLESMKSTPQIDTLLKILAPLGYTLSITPIENKQWIGYEQYKRIGFSSPFCFGNILKIFIKIVDKIVLIIYNNKCKEGSEWQ